MAGYDWQKVLINSYEFQTVFRVNRRADSRFRWRATHINGRRGPKAVLSNDPRIRQNEPCQVRIVALEKPESRTRGHIEVQFVSSITLQLDDNFYVDPALSRLFEALLESSQNILLIGPQGSGKTVLAARVAHALRMRFVFFNASSVHDSTDFLATLQLKATDSGQAETVWIRTDILRALEAAHDNPNQRYLVFLDELNRCRAFARNGIMPALDATRKMYNPLTGSNIAIPDNVQFIAAINAGQSFTATTDLDPAQFDRFFPVRMAYPPETEELRILSREFPRVPEKLIAKTVKAANAVRRQHSDVSVRTTKAVCMLLSHRHYRNSSEPPLRFLLRSAICDRLDAR